MSYRCHTSIHTIPTRPVLFSSLKHLFIDFSSFRSNIFSLLGARNFLFSPTPLPPPCSSFSHTASLSILLFALLPLFIFFFLLSFPSFLLLILLLVYLLLQVNEMTNKQAEAPKQAILQLAQW